MTIFPISTSFFLGSLERDGGKQCSVSDAELLKDVVKVHLDGAINGVQLPSYFLVREPFRYQARYLAFAVGQHCQEVGFIDWNVGHLGNTG